MNIDKIYRKIHRIIEDKEDRKISQREMAEKVGCSLDTYSAHHRGANQPTSVKNFLTLINMLEDDKDILEVIKLCKSKEK